MIDPTDRAASPTASRSSLSPACRRSGREADVGEPGGQRLARRLQRGPGMGPVQRPAPGAADCMPSDTRV